MPTLPPIESTSVTISEEVNGLSDRLPSLRVRTAMRTALLHASSWHGSQRLHFTLTALTQLSTSRCFLRPEQHTWHGWNTYIGVLVRQLIVHSRKAGLTIRHSETQGETLRNIYVQLQQAETCYCVRHCVQGNGSTTPCVLISHII